MECQLEGLQSLGQCVQNGDPSPDDLWSNSISGNGCDAVCLFTGDNGRRHFGGWKIMSIAAGAWMDAAGDQRCLYKFHLGLSSAFEDPFPSIFAPMTTKE